MGCDQGVLIATLVIVCLTLILMFVAIFFFWRRNRDLAVGRTAGSIELEADPTL